MSVPRLKPIRILLAAVALVACAPAPGRAGVVDSVATPIVTPDSGAGRQAGGRSFVDILTEADSVVKARGGSSAPHARLFLSWKQPWGMKGATTALMPDLANSTGEDTLYLCFRPGRDGRAFGGFTATLLLRPAPGDSLGPFWSFSRTGPNAGGLAVQFGPDPSFPMPQPWRVRGTGTPVLDVIPSGLRLRLVYAVSYLEAGPVDSATVLCLGRVLIKHRNAATLAGSAQPVCIEWESATLAYALRDEPEVRLGERFVTWNSKDGAACDPFRGSARGPAWTPGKGAQPRR